MVVVQNNALVYSNATQKRKKKKKKRDPAGTLKIKNSWQYKIIEQKNNLQKGPRK